MRERGLVLHALVRFLRSEAPPSENRARRPNRERENLLGERTRIVNRVERALCTTRLHVPISQVVIASAQNEPKEDFKDQAQG